MAEPLWKNRSFILFISGRMVSQCGTLMTTFVIPWLFLQITGSGTQTGVAFAVGFIPYIIVSFPARVWADRLNRKTLMILADFGRLTLLASIPLVHLLAGETPLSLLYAAQAGISGLSAIFDASYSACLPNLVEAEQLRDANNTLQTSMSLSRIIGPILGGSAMAWIGAANTIVVDVVSYIVSIVTMVAIAKTFSPSRSRKSNTFLQDIRLGTVTVWDIQPIRYLMVFAALVNLVGPGMDVALLYRLKQELFLPSQWAGMIMTGLNGGMLLGSLVNRWASKHVDTGAWLTISAVLQVFPPVVLAMTRNPWVICSIQVFIGILLVAWNVQSVTLRQTLIPNHLLGRSSSVFRLSAWISIPVGDAFAGIIGQRFGTKTYFIVAASVLCIVSILCVCVKLHRVIPEAKSNVVVN